MRASLTGTVNYIRMLINSELVRQEAFYESASDRDTRNAAYRDLEMTRAIKNVFEGRIVRVLDEY